MRPQSVVPTYAFWLLLSTATLTAHTPLTAGGRDQGDPENSEAGQVGLGTLRGHMSCLQGSCYSVPAHMALSLWQARHLVATPYRAAT